jgi:predicted RNase H-like HicB family nuclease
MIREYISAAMRRAHYEIEEDGSYYGEIPDCPGVFASEPSLERCREILEEVLEGWVILGLRMGQSLPVIDGIDLQQKLAA